jgi:hypothetical protein
LDDLATCAKRILKKECTGTPYRSFSNAMACEYRGAVIVFNPKRLFKNR